MSNSIAPGSSADVNVRVTALTTNPNVPVTYKTIILKKNLVNGVNTLTQEMMSAQNTKYVIKYDYVLGEDITVPANCILEFDGGSISAGSGENMDTITGGMTKIKTGLVKIFSTNINIEGYWIIDGAYPEWFGAIADDSTDCTAAIQKILDTKHFRLMVLSGEARYKVTDTDNDGYCLIMRNFTHIISEKKSEIVHFNDNTNPTVLKISINWNDGQTEARGLRIRGVNVTNYDNNWAVEFANNFVLYDLLMSDCSFYSGGGKALKILGSAPMGHSTIRNCTFSGESQLFLEDRNIIEECSFSGAGCALVITSEYGCINNTIQNNTIVNSGGAITLNGVGGVRILNNQIEHASEIPSTHEKSCSIYVKGTASIGAQNIIISNNNLGGGVLLQRSIYIERGFKVVIDGNRIVPCNTNGEEIYIDENTESTIIRSTNYLESAVDQTLRVNDNGKYTVGTRRQFAYLDSSVTNPFTFTLHEDNTITINGSPDGFVLGTGVHLLTFPEDTFPRAGYYQCGNASGICIFKIEDRKLIGVSYDGANYNYIFPVFNNRLNNLF